MLLRDGGGGSGGGGVSQSVWEDGCTFLVGQVFGLGLRVEKWVGLWCK